MLSQQTEAWINVCGARNFRGGFVTRTIINYDDFNVAFVFCIEKGAQSSRDYSAFVISSHHHADRFGKIRFRSTPETIRQPDHD